MPVETEALPGAFFVAFRRSGYEGAEACNSGEPAGVARRRLPD